jgi:hypothetical protein
VLADVRQQRAQRRGADALRRHGHPGAAAHPHRQRAAGRCAAHPGAAAVKLHERRAAFCMMTHDLLECQQRHVWSIERHTLGHCLDSLCLDTRLVIAAGRRDCHALPPLVCGHGGVCLCTRGPGREVKTFMAVDAHMVVPMLNVSSSLHLRMMQMQSRLAWLSSHRLRVHVPLLSAKPWDLTLADAEQWGP